MMHFGMWGVHVALGFIHGSSKLMEHANM